jgi:hypothetical protein
VERDVKEIIGALMRVLGGGEITRGEVEDLAFEASGALQTALNEAYIQLLEFAYDCEARLRDKRLDSEMRDELQKSLDKIIQLSDAALTTERTSSARVDNDRED